MEFVARAYGVVLQSDAPIPGLHSHASLGRRTGSSALIAWGTPLALDGSVSWGLVHVSDVTDDDGVPMFCLARAESNPSLLRLSYVDGTTFWIERGFQNEPDQISAWWPDGMTSEDASTYFLGPVLGYLLRMRGQIVLHASAVGLAPRDHPDHEAAGAVALVGPPGAGKSTTAAAFAMRRCPVLTEDAAALREPQGENAPFDVLPGYPLIRLWADSVEMLYGAPDALPLLTPTWDKRYLALDETGVDAFLDTPLPLRAIMMLERREDSDDAPRAEMIPPAEAFIALVGNTYRNLVLDRDQRIDEFRGLHRLLRTTPVFRIIPHVDPDRIDDLLDLILETAASTPRE